MLPTREVADRVHRRAGMKKLTCTYTHGCLHAFSSFRVLRHKAYNVMNRDSFDCFPPDAHERCSGKVFINITTISNSGVIRNSVRSANLSLLSCCLIFLFFCGDFFWGGAVYVCCYKLGHQYVNAAHMASILTACPLYKGCFSV